ncbi:MAG TPA: hypothetical protein VKY31_01610 [Terriglobia bacterium]|nr:hypothetical protein [Terriglobia bacterium]
MNICKADAIAQLSKWYNAGARVQATYRSVTGNTLIVGKMSELSPSILRITGDGCEMLLYFRETSEYEYNDVRDPFTEGHMGQTSKYPIVIDITFGAGDHLEVSEFPANGSVQ